MQLAVGDTIPLSYYWPATDEDYEIHATLIARNPTSIIASDVELDPVVGSTGLFASGSEEMPDAAFVDALYSVFIVGNATPIETRQETFSRAAAPSVTTIAVDARPLVGLVDGQQMYDAGSISLIQGASRSIKVLLRHEDGEAFDLTGASAITARFQAKPIVTITMADSEIEILEPGARGALVLNLTAVKSQKLEAGERHSFEIQVTKNSKLYVVQFTEALDVIRQIS